jgi:hypothetical protein
MGKLRKFFDSVVYRGLKPVDPLYLSNRSVMQRLRVAIYVAVPCMLLIAVLALTLTGYFRGKLSAPPSGRTAPLTPKLLANVDMNLPIPADHSLDLLEVRIDHGNGTSLSGRVRNKTDHTITGAEVIFDLTDAGGARLGAVTARIGSVEPRGTASFELPIAQETAAAAIVREIHAQ